jgi:hypothetical protein
MAWDRAKRDAIIARYDAGELLVEIAAAESVGRTTVAKIIERAGRSGKHEIVKARASVARCEKILIERRARLAQLEAKWGKIALVLGMIIVASPARAASASADLTVNLSPSGVQMITPDCAPSCTIIAGGHIWQFDRADLYMARGGYGSLPWFTGFGLLRDGLVTPEHGVQLTWDGAGLNLTWHAPTDFDPANGQPWTPPVHTEAISP